MVEAHPDVFLELNTYEDLLRKAESLAAWLNDVRERIVAPLLDHLSRHDAPRHWAGMYVQPVHGVRNALYGYNNKNWHRLLTELREGKLRIFHLLYKLLNEEGYPDLDSLDLEINMQGLEYPGAAHRLLLAITRPLYGEFFTDAVQRLWVDVAQLAAVTFSVSTGYITLDYAGTTSPYEDSIGLSGLMAARALRTRVRGYYWGNFLSEEHIRILGGMQRLCEEAPCCLVEDLSEGQGRLAYLQLTPCLDDFSDDALRELKQFLEPLLPPGEPRYVPLPLRTV